MLPNYFEISIGFLLGNYFSHLRVAFIMDSFLSLFWVCSGFLPKRKRKKGSDHLFFMETTSFDFRALSFDFPLSRAFFSHHKGFRIRSGWCEEFSCVSPAGRSVRGMGFYHFDLASQYHIIRCVLIRVILSHRFRLSIPPCKQMPCGCKWEKIV